MQTTINGSRVNRLSNDRLNASKLSFSRETSALPRMIEDHLLAMSNAIRVRLCEYADRNEDKILHIVGQSAETTNWSYSRWADRNSFSSASLFDLAHTLFKILLVIAMGTSSYIVFHSGEATGFLLFAFAGALVASQVAINLVLNTPTQLLDLYARMRGVPSVKMRTFCASSASKTSVITEKGLIFTKYGRPNEPVFVSWSDIAASKLLNGREANIVLNDHEGNEVARLVGASTETMDTIDVFEFVREQINAAHTCKLKSFNQAI